VVIREELTIHETEGIPVVDQVMVGVETRATEAAYETGKANVPRESVKLETPE